MGLANQQENTAEKNRIITRRRAILVPLAHAGAEAAAHKRNILALRAVNP